MATENSNKLKLAKINNVYQDPKEHLYISNPATFQYFRCNISLENESWKLKNFTDVCMTGGIVYIFNFDLFEFSGDASRTPELAQSMLRNYQAGEYCAFGIQKFTISAAK